MDCGFGLIPAVASLKFQNNKKYNDAFDINDFIIHMKQLMVLEESFFGASGDKEVLNIYNYAYPDRLLFDEIYYNLVNNPNITNGVYEELIRQGFFKTHKTFSRYHSMIKNKTYTKEYSKALDLLQQLINLNYRTPYFPNILHGNTIKDPNLFNERTKLSIELANQLEQQDIKNVIIEREPKLEKQSDSYEFGKNLSVVGIVESYSNENVCHVLCYYHTKNDLKSAFIELDNYLPQVFAKCPPICSQIKKIAEFFYEKQSSYNNEKKKNMELYAKKVLAKPPNSNIILAAFSFTFLKDIIKQKQHKLPLGKLQEYLETNLPEWQISSRQRPNIAWKKIPFCEDCQNAN